MVRSAAAAGVLCLIVLLSICSLLRGNECCNVTCDEVERTSGLCPDDCTTSTAVTTHIDAPEADPVYEFTTELVLAWGEPDSVVFPNDLGLASSQLETVEIWSYENPLRSVIVRDDVVISIQEGRKGLGDVTARCSSLVRCDKCRAVFLNSALARHPRTAGSADWTPTVYRCECAKWGMCPSIR